MIAQLACILAIAIIFYIVLPLCSSYIQKARWNTLYSHIKNAVSTQKEACFYYLSSGAYNEISLSSYKANIEKKINPKQTQFYVLTEKNDHPNIVALKTDTVQKVLYDNLLLYFERTNTKKQKGICILTPSPTISSITTMLKNAKIDTQTEQGGKAYFVAIGVALTLMIFLSYLIRSDSTNFMIFFSLLAVFGKIIPYLPPGVFLLISAQMLNNNSQPLPQNKTDIRHTKKQKIKSKVASYLLFTSGILLNCVLFFSILHAIGIQLLAETSVGF